MDKILRNAIVFSSIIILISIIALVSTLSDNNFSSNKFSTETKSVESLAATSSTTGIITTSKTAQVINGVQEVKLSVVNGKYIIEPSILLKDVPVRMVADMNTLKGCSKSIVIPEFGVKKYVSQGDNIVEFTPTKTGEIEIACSMYMYTGTFTVI
jgi:hypothetical protein